MNPPRRAPPGPSGRWLLLAAAIAAGLISIVGSGGGGGLGSICDTYPDSCQPQPSVAVDPPALAAQVGATVSFTAVAVNTSGGLSYQWRRSVDGGATYTDIAGATDRTLTLAGVNLSDDGAQLRVAVRLADGRVFPGDARLAVSASPPVVLGDGDFAEAQWQAEPGIVAGYPTFAHSEERVATGGDPGAFRRMSTEIGTASSLSRVFHRNIVAVYDPQTQGAIHVLDYRESCRVFAATDTRGVQAGLVLEQGGRRYVTEFVSVVCTADQWVAVAQRALRASDFRPFDGPACGAGEACPDFSASAAPIRFGFEHVASAPPGDTVLHGIDNWQVSIWRR